MVFTLIFIDAGIDLDGEDFKSLTHTDDYTVHSLHRMGYQKVNDQWVWEAEGILDQASGSSSFLSDSIGPSSLAPTVGPSLLAPALTPALVVGEHLPHALVSPHTPFMHHGLNSERVVEKITKKMGVMFADLNTRYFKVLRSIRNLLRDSMRSLVSRLMVCLNT